MPYIGKSPLTGNYNKLDSLSGFNGSTTAFNLTVNSNAITPVRAETLLVSLNGVIQQAVTDYTVSGSQITFTTAPTSGDSVFIIAFGEKLDIGTPSDATVTSAKLASTIFTGATDIGANIADADLFLLDDGAGGTIRKTAASRLKTYIGGSDPASADGDSLGTASLEWSDLYLADGGVIYFGNDQDVTLTHVADVGLDLSGVLQVGNGSDSAPSISFINDPDTGFFRTTANEVRLATNGWTLANVWSSQGDAGSVYYIGDSANGDMTIGITLNQLAHDNQIFALKSSDVAHGVTTVTETDTYMYINKGNSAEGIAQIQGFTEGAGGVEIVGTYGSGNTTKGTGGIGNVMVSGYAADGTGRSAPGTTTNLFCVRNAANARMIVEGNGDIHSDSTSTVGTYDVYEDAHLARALDLTHGRGVIDSKFDKFIAYNHEKLADMNLVGREEDGTPNHFINVTGLQRLHNGAIWQQYERHENLLNAVYELAVEAVGEDKANSILDKNDIKLLSNNELLN